MFAVCDSKEKEDHYVFCFVLFSQYMWGIWKKHDLEDILAQILG